MPYIRKEQRKLVAPIVREMEVLAPGLDAGEFTYVTYKMTRLWLGRKPRFLQWATALGCLLCVILEFYRRGVGPYEDKKIGENGDVD